ncbi:hypothetical protein [Gemmatimonas sp.]|jgi:hypothetical protein|uniref:hypothetical protein n=1 Tax=Gemmatimonas sp. TaxID=1962908 RepID=UPI00391F0C0E
MKQGVFALRTPEDLLGKLRHDVHRLLENHTDSFAAFDVAVAGYHMAEWIEGSSRRNPRERVDGELVLSVARAIANGAKHFETRDPINDIVQNSDRHVIRIEGGINGGAINSHAVNGTALHSWMEIELSPSISNSTGRRTWVAHEWAAQLLAYWEAEFKAMQGDVGTR